MKSQLRKIPGFKSLRRFQFQLKISKAKFQKKEIVHFLHIGKTAGTAIKDALGNQRMYETKSHLVILEQHPFRFSHVPDDHKTYFVVRDPISRFVSGFYSRYREGQPRLYNPWKPAEKEAFERFPKPNLLAEALSNDDQEEKAAAEKGMNSIGHVSTSYWNWFHNEQYLIENLKMIAIVLKQEELTQDFDYLKEKFNIKNASLTKDPVKAHKNSNTFDKKLSDKAIQNLKKWYEDDYRFLNLLYNHGLINRSYQ